MERKTYKAIKAIDLTINEKCLYKGEKYICIQLSRDAVKLELEFDKDINLIVHPDELVYPLNEERDLKTFVELHLGKNSKEVIEYGHIEGTIVGYNEKEDLMIVTNDENDEELAWYDTNKHDVILLPEIDAPYGYRYCRWTSLEL